MSSKLIKTDTSIEADVKVPVSVKEDDPLINQESIKDFNPRTVGTVQLIILVYFWTCGGPFGIEPAVGSGGIPLTVTTLVCILTFWALPQALLSAELSLMMNSNGGNVLWVQNAFGEMIGCFNAWCFLAACICSQAVYIITVMQYTHLFFEFSLIVRWIISVIFVAACFLINIKGIQYLSKLSWVMFGIIFTPFVILNFYIPFGNPRINVNFTNMIRIPEADDIHWSVLISTVVWSLGGYDFVGSIAGEVKGGKKAFVVGILATFPLNLINYLYPLTLTYIVDGNDHNWQSGYFTKLVRDHFPYWLGVLMVISAVLSNFGALASGLSQLAWTIWAMAKGPEDKIAKYRFIPYFMSSSWSLGGETAQPLVALVFVALCDLAVSALDYPTISQIFLVIRSVNVLCEFAALIKLKVSQPKKYRPFEIPGGVIGACLITMPSMAIIVFCLYNADVLPLKIAAGVLAGIILIYPIKRVWLWLNKRY